MANEHYLSLEKDQLIKELEERDNKIAELEEEVEENKDLVSRAERETEELDAENEDLKNDIEDMKPQTMYGELKEEIIKKVKQLPLETLQTIEEEYCHGILGIERNLN